jgi:two-component system response regulator YesN
MVRIENAKAYLRTGLFSVTEVATKCGFDSISYFSCEFHRIVGMTPREYVAKYC